MRRKNNQINLYSLIHSIYPRFSKMQDLRYWDSMEKIKSENYAHLLQYNLHVKNEKQDYHNRNLHQWKEHLLNNSIMKTLSRQRWLQLSKEESAVKSWRRGRSSYLNSCKSNTRKTNISCCRKRIISREFSKIRQIYFDNVMKDIPSRINSWRV